MHLCQALLLIAALLCPSAHGNQEQAVADLVRRLLPDHAHLFRLSLTKDQSSLGRFALATTQPSTVDVVASDGVSLASGVHWYLKYYANCSVSWWGDTLQLPRGSLPPVTQPVSMETPFQLRYYMNTCTFGYSTAFWTWQRWQREIDWMALNSINFPLAFVGQEFVWREFFVKDMGLDPHDLNDFFTGPAFLPWQRMGNLDAWLGPLPDKWLTDQMTLQLRILERMRDLGMTPVLPAFSGFVPKRFQQLYPNSHIVATSGWNGFAPTYQLDPHDPLYPEMGKRFVQRLNVTFGLSHYYNADQFNEMQPASSDPAYLAKASAALYAGLVQADPDAVWVMQGWLFHNGAQFWKPPQIQAYLQSVPHGKLIVLDLYSDAFPVWNETNSFFGTQFIWNMLHNFGGRSGLFGRLEPIASQPVATLDKALRGTMIGIGLTPEAIETNPVVYDLMMENTWRGTAHQVKNIPQWIDSYATRRYGGHVNVATLHGWSLLARSVYNCSTGQEGTSGSIIAARPSLSINQVSCCAPLALYYNVSDVAQSARALLEGATALPTLRQLATFKDDIVQVVAQALTNQAIVLWQNSVQAFQRKDVQALKMMSGQFLSLVAGLDQLLGSRENFLLGSWINSARNLGSDDVITGCSAQDPYRRQNCGYPGIDKATCENRGCCYLEPDMPAPSCFNKTSLSVADFYELNARTQVTLWGTADGPLHEYAYKLWHGLVLDFYHPRWQQFYAALENSLITGVPFSQSTFDAAIEQWELQFTRDRKPYSPEPNGDPFTLASLLCRQWVPGC